MTDQQMMMQIKGGQKKFEKRLDKNSDNLQILKGEAENTTTELKDQNRLIEKMNIRADKTQAKMK